MSTYHEAAGKGDKRRKEDKKAFDKNFTGIDWSVKVNSDEENPVAAVSSEVTKAAEG